MASAVFTTSSPNVANAVVRAVELVGRRWKPAQPLLGSIQVACCKGPIPLESFIPLL